MSVEELIERLKQYPATAQIEATRAQLKGSGFAWPDHHAAISLANQQQPIDFVVVDIRRSGPRQVNLLLNPS